MFKQCPRCGGDVDASYSEDVHCLQCGDRPEVVYPGPVIVGAGGSATGRQLGDRLSWAGDRDSGPSRNSGQAPPQKTGEGASPSITLGGLGGLSGLREAPAAGPGTRHARRIEEAAGGPSRVAEAAVLQELRSWDGPPTNEGELEGVCPRCGAVESVMLEKVRPDYNTCFRCRRCSHVYSP